MFNDPPAHTRVRRLLQPYFSAQAMRRMEAGVAANVDDLLDRAAARGVIDVMSEFAVVIPLNLVCDLLGVPAPEREPLRHWASMILGVLSRYAQRSRSPPAIRRCSISRPICAT